MEVLFSSESVEWPTPQDLYRKLNDEFHFDLDPCPVNAKESGLQPLFMSWRDRRVFCNPPYGPNISAWLERSAEAQIAVYLLPARTDTRWFHEQVLPKASEIRFIKGRLKFGDATNGAPFPSMLVVFKRTAQQVDCKASRGCTRDYGHKGLHWNAREGGYKENVTMPVEGPIQETRDAAKP